MLERYRSVIRIICIILAALICAQVVRIVARKNPLDALKLSATAVAAVPAPAKSESKETNAPPGTNAAPRRSSSGRKKPDLPPAIQARVDRITQSEILGAVVRPLPMALLGIAGQDAFLRAPNGQTGLIREGEELDGVKLLRVGTNRVLVEHEDQKKELTLFSGFGSESLLPKPEKGPQ
ncbi:MAG: hypothetical protein L0Y58_02740 [Verrucomicrobia subdivision 3 bacterium]|nr:hypothetical protein [Limisphaerales bacterium]